MDLNQMDQLVQELEQLFMALTSKTDEVVLLGGMILRNVHPESRCSAGPCPIHNPSFHHMNKWPQHFERETKLMYRICPHDLFHVDPDNYGLFSDCSDDYLTELHDYCCIDPRELTIVDLTEIVGCMPTVPY